ncbi:hypothetical protein OH77DRAFT_1480059 [Trametes cingulata]|nr:hypothetical protein OH77DRAFT_1480059 [Trametes cingulata]
MADKTTRQSKAQPKPYDPSKRGRKTRAQPKTLKHEAPAQSSAVSASAPAVPSPSLALPIPTSSTGSVLYRDFCKELVKSRYPGIEPRNDWELVFMAGSSLQGTAEEVYAELDREYLRDLNFNGSDTLEWLVSETLSRHVEPTGIKPPPKVTNKYVHVRPIPDTPYSIRLFPGSLSAAEYCLDFVHSASGEPVNSPFEFELWGVPDPETPWLSMPMTQRIRSIEHTHGVKQEDVLPGHEKFILRDGLTCVLVRPGKPKIRFTVPVRKSPAASEPAQEVVVLDFPKVIV